MKSRIAHACLWIVPSALGIASCGGGSPEPSPVAVATATPAPVVTAPPLAPGECVLRLPKGRGLGIDCPRTTPQLMQVMNDAVDTVRGRNPGAYPLEDVGFRLTDKQLDQFFKDVVDHINAGGQACAYRDGLELALKSSNQSSEQYKFWVTSGHIRLGENAYRATCTPAWF